jgi:hypothetical protein
MIERLLRPKSQRDSRIGLREAEVAQGKVQRTQGQGLVGWFSKARPGLPLPRSPDFDSTTWTFRLNGTVRYTQSPEIYYPTSRQGQFPSAQAVAKICQR